MSRDAITKKRMARVWNTHGRSYKASDIERLGVAVGVLSSLDLSVLSSSEEDGSCN